MYDDWVGWAPTAGGGGGGGGGVIRDLHGDWIGSCYSWPSVRLQGARGPTPSAS